MSRARDLSKLGNPNVIKADENSVGFGTQVAGNHANADSSLISAGIITATAYYGDGSNLEGVASAGLGTAVDDTKDSIGQNIYFTNQELSINENTTVNAPDTSSIAYTQYQQVTVESGSELIIADGDSFIPDVLGIGTALQASTAGAGNGLFGTVFTDNIENVAGRGGPHFPLGITVAGVSTLSGNVSIGGTLTYEDVTNVDSIGVVTARNGIDITGASAGLNASSNLRLKTAGAERVNITSTGLGIGVNNPSQILEVQGGSAAKPTFKHSAGWGALRVAGSAGGSGSGFILANNYNGTIEEKWSIYLDGSNDGLRFTAGPPETTSAERLRIGSAGQIGLSGANYGTSGQVMTSQGASAAPQWADAGGGAVEVIQTLDLATTNTANIISSGWTSANYSKIVVTLQDIGCGNGQAANISMRLYLDGSEVTSGSRYEYSGYGSNDFGGGNFTPLVAEAGANYVMLSDAKWTYSLSGEIELWNPGFAAGSFYGNHRTWTGSVHASGGSDFAKMGYMMGYMKTSNNSIINGIKFYEESSGKTFTSGKVTVYGYKRS
jgi:hypothetical protein